ncbi:MAG: hypothetical protein U0T83_06280 [Bacteriovoracaceae bacterium]
MHLETRWQNTWLHFDSLVKNLQEMQNKFHIATIVSTNAAPASTMQPLGSENKPLAPIHYTVPLPIYYSYYDLNREKLFQPIQNNNNYFEQTISTFHDFYAISNQPIYCRVQLLQKLNCPYGIPSF